MGPARSGRPDDKLRDEGLLRFVRNDDEVTRTSLRGAKRRSNPGAACIKRWIASLALAMTPRPEMPHAGDHHDNAVLVAA
jgi:hypothetical protein